MTTRSTPESPDAENKLRNQEYEILRIDPYVQPYQKDIALRMKTCEETKKRLLATEYMTTQEATDKD